MLFHITQIHHADQCPIDSGGSKTLYNAKVDGAKLKAMYGAFAEHTIFYLLEADSAEAVQRFLEPGFKRCEATVTPVTEAAMVK
jgi:hypothetical protein